MVYLAFVVADDCLDESFPFCEIGLTLDAVVGIELGEGRRILYEPVDCITVGKFLVKSPGTEIEFVGQFSVVALIFLHLTPLENKARPLCA